MSYYLTVAQVLYLHAQLIERTGGVLGLRDLGTLEAACARPHATFEGQELYADLFSKAAAFMDSIISTRPFEDGNHRTGIAGAALFLRRYDYQLTASNDELLDFTRRVVGSRSHVTDLAQWFQTHSRHSPGFRHPSAA